MRGLRSLIMSRVIYPVENEIRLGDEKARFKTVRRLAKTRLLIRQPNISVPLLGIVMFPVVCLLLTVFTFLHLTGRTPPMLGGDRMNKFKPIRNFNTTLDPPFGYGCQVPDTSQEKMKAALVVLARNKEMDGVVESMKSMERHFNRWYHYPYVFLNDEPFNSTFKETIKNHTKSDVEFGLISPEEWNFPPWADEGEIEEAIAKQGDDAIKYGAMASYHKMCRFYSGKFYNHPLLQKYDWYWRVEPEIKFFCDLTYDPFLMMERSNKVYGFTLIIKELMETVPNLFRYTVGFKNKHKLNSTRTWDLFLNHPQDHDTKDEYEERKKMGLMPDDRVNEWAGWEDDGKVHPDAMNGEVYNLCRFWPNFEIARLDFFRSKEYNDYFEHLERTGGFWTERWGDAPVHSLAAGLFLEPEQIHYFRDIGYRHTTIQHCPGNAPGKQLPHIPHVPNPKSKEDRDEDAYWSDFDPVRKNGVGCRCRCDTDITEDEANPGSCLARWVNLTGGFGNDL